MEGYIHFRSRAGHFLMIHAEDGREYFANRENCVRPYGHFCFFKPGTAVTFQPDIGPDNDLESRGRRPAARLVQLTDPPKIEKEESVIVVWHKRYGWAKRLCGCDIFVSINQIQSGPEALEHFGVGSRILHETKSVVFKGKPKCEAFDIDIFIPEAEIEAVILEVCP